MSSVKERTIDHLESLIEEAGRLDASFEQRDAIIFESHIDEHEHSQLFTSALHTIERIAGRGSRFFENAPKPEANETLSLANSPHRPVARLRGVLVSLRDAVEDGHLQSMRVELRTSIHDDLLEQASDLLSGGHRVAAMVQIAGVLENHLRELCENRDLKWNGDGSIGAYNDALWKNDVLRKPDWRRIGSINDDRGPIAHGDFDRADEADIEGHLHTVRRILADYPE